jgi:exodeoxyribonuclease VII large subunit
MAMTVHSVSDINRYLKSLIAGELLLQQMLVRGEISNFKQYPSGHCYFTLKDNASALKCVMFRSYAQHLRFLPTNGLQVIAGGSISVYERDGVYQLYVESLAPEGTGDIALAFEQLKAKFMAEGLFNEEYKKPLPKFPKKIGVVTSSAGAVLRDIYRVVSQRWPMVQLVLYPVQVQGEGAAEQIAEAIAFFNACYSVDTMIVGRGGGSMEDLQAFNAEQVVRAIFASRIPVISAVGHETDFTLSDFVSDRRAATPSQAAELAVPDRQELKRYLAILAGKLRQSAQNAIAERRAKLQSLVGRPALRIPQKLLSSRRQRLDMAALRLSQVKESAMKEKQHRLAVVMEKLDMLSPVQVLRRGYGIVEQDEKILTSINDAPVGAHIEVRLKDGALTAVVEAIKAQKG